MNGNYGFNVISSNGPTQPTPIIQTLPFQSNPVHPAQNFTVNIAFQAPQEQYQSVGNCFPTQNTFSSVASHNSAFCVNQNGSTYLTVTQPSGIQCVQALETPQGIQFLQVVPQTITNPQIVNLNPMCIQSALIPQHEIQTRNANDQMPQLVHQQLPDLQLKSNIQSQDGETEVGENGKDIKTENSVEENSESNQDLHNNQNPLAALTSMTTSILTQNNGMLQQIQGSGGIFNVSGGMAMPQQVFYTNISDQPSVQSFQILVPTPQGMTVQTVMAGYPSQVVNPLVSGMIMNGSPAIPQYTDTVPHVLGSTFTQQPVSTTPVAAPIPPTSISQVKTVTSPSNTDPVNVPEALPQASTNLSVVPGPTSPQLPDSTEDLGQPTIKQSTSSIVDGIDLEEIREFARTFKMRRLVLGLTQTQVGQALSATEGPAYSQSAICRFEKLDITPRSAAKIRPVLEQWLKEAEEKYQQGNVPGLEYIGLSTVGKIRKRRTFFSPEALAVLNARFDKNSHPSGREINNIASEIGYDRDTVRVWFCNKRQSLRHTAATGGNAYVAKHRVSHLNPVNASTSPSSSTSCSPLPS